MTADQKIRAEFRSTLGDFTLDTSFDAPIRGVTALFGPSGCGKTVVLRCIAGLIRLKDGFFNIGGEIWQDRDRIFIPTYQRPLGYVLQEASLFPHLSVRRNLLFGAPRGRPADPPTIDFDEVVDLLGIRALLDRTPRNLSGGERQRVGMGRALLTQPKLLLMDEPLSALDRKTKAEILPFIEKLRDHLSLPIFYVTHDLTELERLADHIVLLERGHPVASAALSELQSDPSSPLAASREAAVTLRGVVEAADPEFGVANVSITGGMLVAPPPPLPTDAVGEPRRIRILASDVSLAREKPSRSSILNVLPARVVAMKPLDSYEVLVVVALGENGDGARLLSRITQKSWAELGLAEGLGVYAQVKYVSLGPGRGEAEE
jgi:molybdate transport system ATP-binding protein